MILKESDKDQSFVLNAQEIYAWVQKYMGPYVFFQRLLTNSAGLDEAIKRFMKQCDSIDVDGELSFVEIEKYFATRGVAMKPDRSSLKSWIEEADYMGDGLIDATDVKIWAINNLGFRGEVCSHLKGNTTDAGVARFI